MLFRKLLAYDGYMYAWPAIFTFFCATLIALPAMELVPLSSMDISAASQGWGTPQINRSIREKKLSVGGQEFETGLGTHATFRYIVRLNKGTQKFISWVGVDDSADSDGKASVQFRLVADGDEIFISPVMHEGDAPLKIDVDLTEKEILVLSVLPAGDGISFDHANWCDAFFHVTGEKPVPGTPWRGQATILTPKPSAKPKINGAKVFGVRPDSPFLFTIAATGSRPMSFFAEQLPEGLQLDTLTGQIQGKISLPGTYPCSLIASNALGVVKRPFRIECGNKIALTPHMGWNSWYIWENNVTDKIIRDAADAMVSNGMIQHGYQYINIDDCWAIKPGSSDPTLQGTERDDQRRILSNNRFPDMKALTDYIHSKGLKAGIYSSPGRLTCAGFVGSYGHELDDVQRFVEWGFDFLKYDWCSYGKEIPSSPTSEDMQKPYWLISKCLGIQSRDIVLNLCQYGMSDVWEWGGLYGQSWRTAGDLGLSFEKIAHQIYTDGFGLDGKQSYHKPGQYNDPDYILIGVLSNWKGQRVPTPLTPDEQYTHVTLWSLLAAPLIFSGDITQLDDFTLSLLTNDELIEVNQDTLCLQAHCIKKEGDVQVWVKALEDGSRAVGIFNMDDVFHKTTTLLWSDLGIEGEHRVRDIWRQEDIGVLKDNLTAKINPHGCIALRIW